jgi:CRISPR/Cas system-associated exonuclease Cas4 (RecB family)
MAYKLSPSAINLYLECPRCFWLDKHGVWKRPASVFPSLPSGMDRILKEHFDRFRDKGELPPEICDHEHCNGLKLFGETDAEKELINAWRNNFKGVRYTDKKGNVLFGAVDNILKNRDTLVVLDYKTRGFPVKEDTHEHYQNQMDTYNFLLRENGYKTEDYTFLLFYMPSKVMPTGEVIFDTTLVKIKTNPKNGEKTFKKAIKCLEEECPQKTCNWCEKV